MIGNLGSWVVHVRAKRCSARPVANMGSMGRERDVIPGVISVPAGHVFAGIRETNEEKRRKSGVFEAGGAARHEPWLSKDRTSRGGSQITQAKGSAGRTPRKHSVHSVHEGAPPQGVVSSGRRGKRSAFRKAPRQSSQLANQEMHACRTRTEGTNSKCSHQEGTYVILYKYAARP
jgi:hypothetical protein